ncbi:MAG: hypothetical protein ACYTAO_07870 [Planctomycetota bacterium]|jgi:hypothetical protein
MKKIVFLLTCVFVMAVCGTAPAGIISHVPNDMVPPVVKTPPFGVLVPGGIVGTAGIDFGVDYSYGGIEGIFDNGGGDEGAIGGINASNVLDLVSDVDGAIVALGTTTPARTSYLSIEAGFAANGSLLLEVFDKSGTLITSVLNGLPLGPHGRTTMTIDRGGIFDIAFFRVSGNDTYGVDQIDMEQPVIPAPGAILLGGIGVGCVSWLRRRRTL